MTPGAHAALFIYLLLYTIGLPVFVDWHAANWPGLFTSLQYNMAYLLISFTAVLLLGWRYLRAEFDTLLDRKLLSLLTLLQGYFIHMALNYLLLVGILAATGGDPGWVNPNNENIVGMAADDVYRVLCMTVFLAPVAEEVLFRGVIFGWLREKDRLAAYLVTTVLFSLLHVWQYAFVSQDLSVLLYALDYLPAGIVLAWCYDRSGSIWTSIFFHMGINLSALLTLY